MARVYAVAGPCHPTLVPALWRARHQVQTDPLASHVNSTNPANLDKQSPFRVYFGGAGRTRTDDHSPVVSHLQVSASRLTACCSTTLSYSAARGRFWDRLKNVVSELESQSRPVKKIGAAAVGPKEGAASVVFGFFEAGKNKICQHRAPCIRPRRCGPGAI